ncbi:odorant receptor 13a-like [Frieseomelitta varia]|uniref:odorant receptor 13a-like n=1 Tax=Frieseomelitta varia TaxID=561572 RepID=UPI001CB69B15|nr:odorant receptor 13a-like [Frieseomelitta varia]
MDYDTGLKVALGWNRRNMELIGVWPEPTRTDERLPNFKVLFFMFLIFLFGILPENVNLYFIWGDLDLVMESLTMANVPAVNATIKFIYAWYYKESLKPVIKCFYDDWYNVKTEEEKALMLKMAKPAKFISVWCSMLGLMMLVAYHALRIYTIFRTDKASVNQDRLIIYPVYFPFDIRPTSRLLIINSAQVIAGYSDTIAYTTIDTFIAMLIMHICGQFAILKKKLLRLMDSDRHGSKGMDDFQRELALIINKHEQLNGLATTIEECFSMLLLIQLLFCTIEICLQGFILLNVILQNENGIFHFQMVHFIIFISFVLVHIYLYCYIGEMLLVQNRELSDCAYESNWYNVSPPEARCLLFIMKRSIRPLRLTAGKFSTFSMEMFSSILKTAMGYLSVLLTVI